MRQQMRATAHDEHEESFFSRIDPAVSLRTSSRLTGAEVVDLVAPRPQPQPDRRRMARRLAAFGAAGSLVAFLVVGALAPHEQNRPTPSLALTSPPMTPAASAASPVPTSTPEVLQLARGVSVRALGYALEAVPSPSGQFVAAIDSGDGSGVISILARDGQTVASLTGTDLAWLDDNTVLVYEPAITDPNIGYVSRWSLGGMEELRLPGAFRGMLGAAGGEFVALIDTAPADAATAPGFTLYTLADGIVGGQETGIPIAWSPTDGYLAVWEPSTGDNSNSPLSPGRLSVRLEPGGRSTPIADYVALPSGVSFSPDGLYLAGEDPSSAPFVAEIAAGTVYPFGNNIAFAAWTPNDRAVLQGPDNFLALWAPDASITDIGQRQAGTLTYGPYTGEIATITKAPSGAGSSVTVRMLNSSVTFATRGGASATWLPDGSACLIVGGTDDVRRARDVLYWVQLP